MGSEADHDRDQPNERVIQTWVTDDGAGQVNLENHLGGDEAENYRQYEFDTIGPFVGRSLLEVGSGLGDFSAQFDGQLDRLVVSDIDPYCVEQLKKKYVGRDDVEVLEFGLPDEIPLAEPVETVVAMNVLEHIEKDVDALRSLAKVTKPGGRIVIWVPGYMQLYGDFDRKVGHVTRYTPKTLRASMEAAGLEVEVMKPINMLGGIAWWLAVRIGGASDSGGRLTKVYDRTVVPVTRFIEKIIRPPFGQTVIGVARVPE
ncbi:MAG TPA: class I SAM-dependent methyltransferase [Streptosporangiaceae bacterium]|jgi:SAM-dependent methyltransferase